MMPITPVLPVRSVRAEAFGRHPSPAIASRTFACGSGRMCGSPFTTRETVFTETPARSATSRIVTRMGAKRRRPLAPRAP